jgi:hypothetical protein
VFRDEYAWSECRDEVLKKVTLLLRGSRASERERFFLDEWSQQNSNVTIADIVFNELDSCTIQVFRPADGAAPRVVSGSISSTLREFFRDRELLRSVAVDITSLQHAAIMCVVKLLMAATPGELFAVYAEPANYERHSVLDDFRFSSKFLGNKSVPLFAKTQRNTERTIAAFIGFEGERVSRLLEDRENVTRLIPVLGFPAYRPGWNTISLASAGRVIKSFDAFSMIRSCAAVSVGEAYRVLTEIRGIEENRPLIVAPLGTRPHTLAAALFVCRNSEDTRLAYDHPVETAPRSKGIGATHAYHLSGFLS